MLAKFLERCIEIAQDAWWRRRERCRNYFLLYTLTKMVQRSNVFKCFAPPKLSGHSVKAHKPSPD